MVLISDKLFVSHFWKALTKLTRIKLKMSTAYHPEMDSSSERLNKTINQMLQYHIWRNQRGWVRTLPHIRFQMMNTVNAATGFTNFQLHLGRSLRIMPPIAPAILSDDLQDVGKTATVVIQCLTDDVAEAQDNLLLTKITQAHHASSTWAPEHVYKAGDFVMLSTANCRHEYKKRVKNIQQNFFCNGMAHTMLRKHTLKHWCTH